VARDARFDVLFEPVQIGPVTTRNRFYQVPHCTGMGYRRPQTLAAMREVKAEGGWGVVNTEYCSIHPSADDDPYPTQSLWDDDDVRAHALMVDKVHSHGALAGVELWHGGAAAGNAYTREVPLATRSKPVGVNQPLQTRTMDKADIREFRRWHVEAARRAKSAGFDIVYIYACHWYLLREFLLPSNRRTDEYGGSIENRTRLLRELIEETKEAIGDTCGVAVRFGASFGELDEEPNTSEPRAMIEILGDLPDLWDITVHDYSREMGTSRFVKEASLEACMSWVKQVTGKPVVSVGRLTSPDTMLRLVNQGVVDLIGAARPSIADPFLPKKIEEGRVEDIRECIGCNICYAGDQLGVPIRCTQNPTMGEEWRRGWHPERIPEKGSDRSVLVVGAGPAGLDAALSLGQRGYAVTLAEARTTLGGRVTLESELPGLAEWARVRDWRVSQLNQLPNVEIFLDSALDAEQILEFGADRVALATGALWRRDGTGRWHTDPIEGWERPNVFTPDEVMGGLIPAGPVLVFDDDLYYMGGTIAEKLQRAGVETILATTAAMVSSWTEHTDEQVLIQARLIELGVRLELSSVLEAIGNSDGSVELSCAYTGRRRELDVASVVMVTSREPEDALYHELESRVEITRIGDCQAPGTIATAVYSGHRYAREMDDPKAGDVVFLREHAKVP
jgi:dimethylamine/trimethylamine dehydrogenase